MAVVNVKIPSVSFASEQSITSVTGIKHSKRLKRFRSAALVVRRRIPGGELGGTLLQREDVSGGC